MLLRRLPLRAPPHTRPFLTSSAPLHITTARTLPFPAPTLYNLVRDIDSYSSFLPYCTGSKITQRDSATQLPTEADLRVGWGSYDEAFRSKVTCRPEAGEVEADAGGNPLFEMLRAKWSIVAAGGDGARVELAVRVRFTNPIYAAVGAGVVPRVAEVMVEAFEKRAREVLGKGEAGGT